MNVKLLAKTLRSIEEAMKGVFMSKLSCSVKTFTKKSYVWKFLAVLGHLLFVYQKHGYQIEMNFKC